MHKKLVFALLLVVSLTGCLSQQEIYEAQFYATQNAEYGIIPPPKYLTLAATAYNLRLTPTPQGTATPNPNYTPTLNGFQYAGTQAAQVQNNAMTAQVQQQQFEMEKLKAEQAAEQARVQAQQHNDLLTAQAREAYLQATAQAQYMQMTVAAQATERAVIVNNNATGTAAARTAVVQPTSDSLTLQAARILQTVEAGEADKVALAVRRQEMKNSLDAYLPWGIILALAYVFGRGFTTYVKERVHGRDEHGRTPTITRQLPDGGMVMIRPDQLETGIVKVSSEGEVVRYAPMDKEEQSHINKGNIIAEIVGQLPAGQTDAGKNLLSKFAGPQATPPARIVVAGDGSLRSAIEEADQKMIEESL